MGSSWRFGSLTKAWDGQALIGECLSMEVEDLRGLSTTISGEGVPMFFGFTIGFGKFWQAGR